MSIAVTTPREHPPWGVLLVLWLSSYKHIGGRLQCRRRHYNSLLCVQFLIAQFQNSALWTRIWGPTSPDLTRGTHALARRSNCCLLSFFATTNLTCKLRYCCIPHPCFSTHSYRYRTLHFNGALKWPSVLQSSTLYTLHYTKS